MNEGVSVSFIIKNRTNVALEQYCELTSECPSDIADKAIARFLAPYNADEGYPKKAACNEIIDEIKDNKCYVLGEKTMFGAPYYRILRGKQLYSVPIEKVQIT